jgi:LmbE family N-acetylglucosaminyl deacetylase
MKNASKLLSVVSSLPLVVMASHGALDAESNISHQPLSPSSESKVVTTLKQAKRVLWLAAHPDDETSSSALLARAKDLAGTLYLVSLTSGENSDLVWDGLHRGSQIGSARAKLFASAASLLRADGYEVGPFVNGPFLRAELDAHAADAPHRDWPSKTMSDNVIAKWDEEGEPLGYVVSTLRKLKPEVVIAMDHHCGVSGHVEHLAVGKLLVQALPLAADPSAYPHTGEPWKVRYLIFNAAVMPELVACRYCKCEGQDLPDPVEDLLSVKLSPQYGMTYFGVTCLVARTYENAMKEKRWTKEEITTGCRRAEQAALLAVQQGRRNPQLFESFRVRVMP